MDNKKLVYLIEDKVDPVEYWKERAEDSGQYVVKPFVTTLCFFDYASKNSLKDGDYIVVDKNVPGADNADGEFIEMLADTDFSGTKILTSAEFTREGAPNVKGFDYVLSKKYIIDDFEDRILCIK
jgi:hypothetical protein